MVGLYGMEWKQHSADTRCVMTCLAFLTELPLVTDRQTDTHRATAWHGVLLTARSNMLRTSTISPKKSSYVRIMFKLEAFTELGHLSLSQHLGACKTRTGYL